MNEIELAECRYIKPFHLCQQSSPIFLVHLHGGCEASLFIPTPNIPLTCDKRIAKINQPLFIQLIQSNTWLYFTPKENLDVTRRSSNVRESVKIHSSGVFHLNENCSAYGQSIILTSHSTFIREVRVNFTPEIDLRKSLDLNLSFLNTVDIQPLARSSVIIGPNAFDTLRKISSDLNNLKDENSRFHSITKWLDYHNIVTYFLFIVILILIIYLESAKLKKCLRPVDKPQSNPLDIPNSQTQNSENPNSTTESSVIENDNFVPRYHFQK
ncbi:hypothetical protein HHI36_022539 [Cryptolaemus montrouzieri]|uniref:Uncharacterized protein n=1 Tax=Cryptolaemus montrouzieri TaxID=559131 RepID=A0ABD2N0T7_9CUCU